VWEALEARLLVDRVGLSVAAGLCVAQAAQPGSRCRWPLLSPSLPGGGLHSLRPRLV
jgi:hypothetical protein